MHRDIEKLAGLFEELEESGDEAAIMEAIMDGSLDFNEIPQEMQERFQVMTKLRSKIKGSLKPPRKSLKKPFTMNEVLFDKDARNFLDAENSEKMTDTKMITKLLFESEAASFERAIAKVKDPVYKERLIKGISAHFLASNWAKGGRDGAIIVDSIQKHNPDIDLSGTIAESFHDTVRRGQWNQAFHIFNDFLLNDEEGHLDELSPEAKQALVLEYIHHADLHPMDNQEGLLRIMDFLQSPTFDHMREKGASDSNEITETTRKYAEEEVIEARQSRAAILKLLRG